MVKTFRGNQGKGQFICFNQSDLKKLFNLFQEKNDFRYLIQPFLSHAEEYRFVILNNRIQWKVKKRDKTNPRKKVETIFLLAKQEDLKTPIQYIQHVLERNYLFFASFDFLKYQNKWSLLEVNNTPGIIELEKATNENIAQHILKSLPGLF